MSVLFRTLFIWVRVIVILAMGLEIIDIALGIMIPFKEIVINPEQFSDYIITRFSKYPVAIGDNPTRLLNLRQFGFQ